MARVVGRLARLKDEPRVWASRRANHIGEQSTRRTKCRYPCGVLDAAAQQSGKSGDALVDTVLPKLKASYGDWGWFQHFAPRNIQQTAAELDGRKRVPTPGVP